MRNLILAAMLLASAGAASAGVTVKYEDPDKFQDVPKWEKDREQVLKDLSAHFAKLGKDLPADETLNITVTDIDLAGWVEPSRRRIDDIRILRGGADWPMMKLQYTLERNGQVIRSGDERITNMMYQQRINRYDNSDYLRYEKQMIDDWYHHAFPAPKISRADH
jgi:hypothetical protein